MAQDFPGPTPPQPPVPAWALDPDDETPIQVQAQVQEENPPLPGETVDEYMDRIFPLVLAALPK